MKVVIDGKKHTVRPKDLLGAGGEAEIFHYGADEVLKIFKPAQHPSHRASPELAAAAEARIQEHQRKLPVFPRGLPNHVLTPSGLIYGTTGNQVVGYRMPKLTDAESFFGFADPGYRRRGGDSNRVVRLLTHAHRTLSSLHSRGVVVGDLNDANLLAKADETYFLDADSYQFGGFASRVFTTRFVDPRLCDPAATSPLLVRPYDEDADWYAFSVLVMRSLLCVGPFGGIYKPKDPASRIPHGARPLHGISVWHPEVRYPKPATRPGVLPEEVEHELRETFERGTRGVFPRRLLEDLEFKRCDGCKREHGRPHCPDCHSAKAKTRTIQRTRGSVRAEVIFETPGVILAAARYPGGLRVIHHHDGAYRNESGHLLFEGDLDTALRFHLLTEDTVVTRGRDCLRFGPDRPADGSHTGVDLSPEGAAVAGFGTDLVWMQGGVLYRSGGVLGPRRVGDLLEDRTRIWLGPTFGLGFYQVGRMSVVTRFDRAADGIADHLEPPPIAGEVVDARCTLDDRRAWLFVAARHGGRLRHLVRVYDRRGGCVAEGEYPAEEAVWAGHLGGKLAFGGHLFSAADGGLARVELSGRSLEVTRTFPETEPFVDSQCRLLPGSDGLLVVGERTIQALRLGPTPTRGGA